MANTKYVNTFTDVLYRQLDNGQPDLSHPLNPKTTGIDAGGGQFIPSVYVMTFADNAVSSPNAVSYALSPSAVTIDLGDNTANLTNNGTFAIAALQHGGSAEGDVLVDVSEVTGSGFDDVIRGSDASVYFNPANPDTPSSFVAEFNQGFPAAQDIPGFPEPPVTVAVVHN